VQSESGQRTSCTGLLKLSPNARGHLDASATDHLFAAQNAYSAINVQAFVKDASLQAFELEVLPELANSVASLANSAHNQGSAIAEVIDDKISAAKSTSNRR
jgi:hypothetical protein